MKILATFSGFSVDDIETAKTFYKDKLGCAVEEQMGGASITLPGDAKAWMYPKNDHAPATYTMLDFVVSDIDAAVDELTKRGIEFIHYPGSPQDKKGIMRGKKVNMGPNIAWFADPAGNILAVLEN